MAKALLPPTTKIHTVAIMQLWHEVNKLQRWQDFSVITFLTTLLKKKCQLVQELFFN